MTKQKSLVPLEKIGSSILQVRNQKVILDADLANLYGTTTKRLNEQVRRNQERFPEDFMFQLSPEEHAQLLAEKDVFKSKAGRGGRRYMPYAFTEHGAIMAAGLINTPIAIEVSIFVVRAFVQLRQVFQSHAELARKLDALEKKYDAQFKVVFDAIRRLMEPPRPRRRQVGFHAELVQAGKKKAPARKRKPAKNAKARQSP